MTVSNQLIQAISTEEVRNALKAYPEFEASYLDSEIFSDQVAYRVFELNMSVNEIVNEFKFINGIKIEGAK